MITSHEIDYKIFGKDLQFAEIELDQDETVIAEAGAMLYMDSGIDFEAKMGDGSNPDQGFMNKVFSAAQRNLTGESIFMTHFTNRIAGKQRVAFAAPFPGKIVGLDLSKIGGKLICQKDAFLCAALGTKLSIELQKRLGIGFFGGEGFILQKLEGDGKALIHACGGIIKKQLNGETLKVDTGCLVAFTQGIEYDIQPAGNMKSMFFGGEGLFLTTLSGHGIVLLQSLPFSKLSDRILQNAPSAGGDSHGEGSVLGNLSNLFEK